MASTQSRNTGVTSAIWILRAGITLMCAGVAWHDLTYDGPIFEYLWLFTQLDETTAVWIERVGCFLLLLCLPIQFLDRGWPVLLFVSLWMALRGLTAGLDTVWYPELLPLENAVRVLGPLALVGLLGFHPADSSAEKRMSWIDPLLRLSAAMTFIGHGLAALFLKADFTDFILDASRDIILIEITQSTAETLLYGIGVLDLVVAALVLLPFRLRWVVGWMCFWGLLTSFARITRYGTDGVSIALLRAMNWAVPLSLYVYWTWDNDSSPADP